MLDHPSFALKSGIAALLGQKGGGDARPQSPSPSGEGLGVGRCLAEKWVLLDFPTPTPSLKGRG
jgi:hypothetical protein